MTGEHLGRHEDARGTIIDLLGPVDAVTEILTRKNAVRGNHTHVTTTQYTYIARGSLLVVSAPLDGGRAERIAVAGEMITEAAGIPHAWRALEDTVCLVLTRGPRSAGAYESDTFRLTVPLLT